jgi:Glycosyl hydrolase 36 superfamily, catalytic domain
MPIDRRQFLTGATLAVTGAKLLPDAWAVSAQARAVGSVSEKAYGSGYFGEWVQDEHGLPAFRYRCDQINDAKAKTEVNPGVLGPTEHIHQVGNERIVAIASNYGHVRVRQDEGAPKFLNDYAPERGHFAGGFGYLTDGKTTLGTFYSGNSKKFERTFGIGYFRKKVAGETCNIDQIIFAPFGDDPVLVSQVTVTNSGTAEANLRWIEYWGCQIYQFSFRSFMEGLAGNMHELRRKLGIRFSHQFRSIANGAGLLESKEFLGRDPSEEQQFRDTVAYLEKSPNPFLTAPAKDVPKNAAFDDLNPPPTFLVSLDASADGMSSNGKGFFGTGGTNLPSGIKSTLDGDLSKGGPESALLLERKFLLKPGESRVLTFLYGYVVSGVDVDSLISKYRQQAASAFGESSAQWKKNGLRFSTPEEPWVEREITWNHYYLRSGFTYDDFFHQHIISQASIYQYVMGFQGAARDPLQHALPLLFSDPDLVKEVLRYTLKEVRPDGSVPYGIIGHGMPMPTTSDNSSDMPLWLIWAVSEYILATRDVRFLDSDVVTVYGATAGRDSVRNLLARCYKHLINDVKPGEHGLMRMLQDDWNDALVNAWVPQSGAKECVEKGESVLNSAMGAYVFDYYARMLAYVGDDERITTPIRRKAEEHRVAIRAQWTGKWFRRAWLGPAHGWLGEKCIWIEPQPWAIISRTASEEQTRILIESINKELRSISPIGAIQLGSGPDQAAQQGPWHLDPGTQVNGGVWPSLNQTLIWALASVDPVMAWDEWKKNSFARHAEVYPNIWYGTWSGPDVLNSAGSKHPGETTGGRPFGWTDFPVLNMHTHACPLYSLTKLLGIEFTETGVALAPMLPLSSFRFESPLLGLIKSERGYEGWYNPTTRNTLSVRLIAPAEEVKRLQRIEVNGNKVRPRMAEGALELRGEGGEGNPLKWSAFRG